MYRNYQEESCNRGGSRPTASAYSRNQRQSQAIALALPRRNSSLLAPLSPVALLLIIISSLIVINLVLILLGL